MEIFMLAISKLFDDNYTIVAIIDWAYSHTVPLDIFAHVPGGDYLWPEYYLQKMSPKSSSWIQPLQTQRFLLRELFLKHVQESQDIRAGELVRVFETPRNRIGMIFREYCLQFLPEMFEMAFGEREEDIWLTKAMEWFDKQDIEKMLNERSETDWKEILVREGIIDGSDSSYFETTA
jgi:hypothetical protein